MTPGTRLRNLRESLGRSTYEVAQSVNCRPEYIEEIENGKKTPSTLFWQSLADYFIVDIDVFLTGKVPLPSHITELQNPAIAKVAFYFLAISTALGSALAVLVVASLCYVLVFLALTFSAQDFLDLLPNKNLPFQQQRNTPDKEPVKTSI